VQAVGNIIAINEASLQYHQQECHSHPYSSLWYTWPVMEHPVLFYLDQGSGTAPIASITNMGNPAVWWLAIPALMLCVWRMTRGPTGWRLAVGVLGVVSLVVMILVFNAAVRYHDPTTQAGSYTADQFMRMFKMQPSVQYQNARVTPGPLFLVAFAGMIVFAAGATLSAVISRAFVPAFIVLGYVASWMMWVPGNERRVLFFYHALGMLIFASLALAYALTAVRRIALPVGRWHVRFAPLSYAALGLAVAAFAFFYPVWTASTQTFADHEMRVWVDTW
jgi:dolichyl-phosphate-mannose--protein O-mannosyl transferase